MGRFCKSFLFVIFCYYNCHHLRQDLHFSGGDTSTNVTHLQAPGIVTHIKKFLCVLRRSGHGKLRMRKLQDRAYDAKQRKWGICEGKNSTKHLASVELRRPGVLHTGLLFVYHFYEDVTRSNTVFSKKKKIKE